MNQQDKKLLLKDLSARLPYQPIVRWNNTDVVLTHVMLPVYIENCKPYLRPLSSMTEEENEELNCLCYHNISVQDNMLQGYMCGCEMNDVLDWLNAHYFDYRNLIERGLAIDCTNLNVY